MHNSVRFPSQISTYSAKTVPTTHLTQLEKYSARVAPSWQEPQKQQNQRWLGNLLPRILL